MRTSKSQIVIRSFIVVFVVSMMLAGLWNWATETRFWGVAEIALGSLFIVGGFGLFGWIIVNVGTRLICRNDPEFQQYLGSGGDPYLDTLPPPMNPDSEVTRQTGLQEPEYDGFVPPVDWRFQCPRCGSRVQHRIDVCWACRYGHDGDSTAYYERWGHLHRE